MHLNSIKSRILTNLTNILSFTLHLWEGHHQNVSANATKNAESRATNWKCALSSSQENLHGDPSYFWSIRTSWIDGDCNWESKGEGTRSSSCTIVPLLQLSLLFCCSHILGTSDTADATSYKFKKRKNHPRVKITWILSSNQSWSYFRKLDCFIGEVSILLPFERKFDISILQMWITMFLFLSPKYSLFNSLGCS